MRQRPGVGIGLLGVALAFGLTVLTGAYTFGPISGGHFNPAVSFQASTARRGDQRQAAEAAHHEAVDSRRWVIGVECEVLGSRQKSGEDDLRLEASQWRADAEVDPASEREVVLRSRSIEHHVVGPVVLSRIPVGCTSEEEHGRPCCDGDPAHFGRPSGVA